MATDPPHRARLLATPDKGLGNALLALRHSLVDRFLLGGVLVAVVGVPASALRSLSSGWQPLHSFHLLMGVLAVAAYLARGRLSDRFKEGYVICMFWAVGTVGLFTLGLLGAGIWWLSLCALMVSILYSVRAGLLTFVAVVLTLVLAATGFTQGWLVLAMDANAYIRSPAAWATVLVGTVLMPLVVFGAVAGLHATTLRLLREVEEQRLQIARLATHDELTGLPTLTLAFDRLRQALLALSRSQDRIAVFFIDLDGFKAVNDQHGHAAGNHVLREVAQRLQRAMRAGDTVARVGGDEFIAILSGLQGDAEAGDKARELVQCVSEPVEYEGLALSVSASIGIAVARDPGVDPDRLIRRADAAMYQAKHAGRNRIHGDSAPTPASDTIA